eukprot:TRINITY_DN32142_c0_g1_i1.p1 TRINITY_DN32142_c0_g1~~TRINITY_DN32142_c0_g1_i1.p1  ORF type:complete len:274 (+),score=88.73 TRINITY_DN32142_c0_g1_i1:89-910(+)
MPSPTFRGLMGSMDPLSEEPRQQRVIPVSTRGITWVNNPLSPYKGLREKFMRLELRMYCEVPPLKVKGASSFLASGTQRNRAPSASPKLPPAQEEPAKPLKKVTGASHRLYAERPIVYKENGLRDAPEPHHYWVGMLRKTPAREAPADLLEMTASERDRHEQAEDRRTQRDEKFARHYFHEPLAHLSSSATKEREKEAQAHPPPKLDPESRRTLYKRLASEDVERRRNVHTTAVDKAAKRPSHLWRRTYPTWGSRGGVAKHAPKPPRRPQPPS